MWSVVALYKFVVIEDTAKLRECLVPAFKSLGLCGTLLVAPEGVNGTLAGLGDSAKRLLTHLREHVDLDGAEIKFSTAVDKPFQRLKVKLKSEIVTLRDPRIHPAARRGTYVEPQAWNELIERDDVLLLDTRNRYETSVGIFKGASDPNIRTFTEFKDYVRKNLDPARTPKIAMFCTGGIRCEKASAFMLQEGFQEVYHLKGGILRYLEEVPAQESLWEGACFVFDEREALGHGLVEPKKHRQG